MSVKGEVASLVKQMSVELRLRDYHAAHAPDMPEFWLHEWGEREGHKDENGLWKDNPIPSEVILEATADWRYAYADVMLCRREHTPATGTLEKVCPACWNHPSPRMECDLCEGTGFLP